MVELKSRLERGKELLVNSDNPEWDKLMKGYIRAYQDILDVEADEGQDLIELVEEAE